MLIRRLFPLVTLAAACAAPSSPTPKPEVKDDTPPAARRVPVEYPYRFEDLNPDPSIVEVELVAQESPVGMQDGHTVMAWTYNGSVPGPLLEANVGDRVIIHFRNKLAEPTTVHWHGLRIPNEMDGVVRVQSPVPPEGTFDYDFIVPDAGSYWYHPHMRPMEQVERGLYGPIVIHEKDEKRPDFDADRYFVLDDVRLDSHGDIEPPMNGGMDTMHGRYGNTLLVNGMEKPPAFEFRRGDVERWRFVNTANARTQVIGLKGASFRLVGTDGGLLPAPVEGLTRLTLPVGARLDVEVRYTADTASLATYIAYLDNNNQVQEDEVILIEGHAGAEPGGDPTRILKYPASDLLPLPEKPVVEHAIEFSGYAGANGTVFTINGKAWPQFDDWTETVGSERVISITNKLGMEHPFHLHGQFFRTILRNGKPANEPGLRDTVLIEGGDTVVISASFTNPGDWMYHCHIHEHSEAGMMALVKVLPASP